MNPANPQIVACRTAARWSGEQVRGILAVLKDVLSTFAGLVGVGALAAEVYQPANSLVRSPARGW